MFGSSLYDAYSLLSEGKEYFDDVNDTSMQWQTQGSRSQQMDQQQQQQPAQQQQQQQPTKQQQAPRMSTPISLLPQNVQAPMQMLQTQQVQQQQMQQMQQQQQQPQKPSQNQKKIIVNQETEVHYRPSSPSYLDQLGSKRKEVIKVIGYALMILFALTLYTGIDFWLKDLIEVHDLSFKQELGIRMAYPLLVLFVMWNFKILN